VNIAAARSPPFGGIIGQADPPVIEKPNEGRPALQHVVDRLGSVRVARQPSALGPHPAFERDNQRLDPFLSNGMPLMGRRAVDLSLDGEDLVDAANRFDRQWHLPQVGQHIELAPAVGPARGFGNWPRSSPRLVQFAEPGISVGLQDTGPAREMPSRMLAAAVTRVKKHGGRRIAATARPVVPDITP
jgi:hypothetical protein